MNSEDNEARQAYIQSLQHRITELQSQLSSSQRDHTHLGIAFQDQTIPQSMMWMTEDKYRILIENTNDAILVAQSNTLAFYNRRTAELTGYDYDELRDLAFVELIHPDDWAMVVDRYNKRLRDEDVPEVYTFRAVKKSGEDFWVEIHAVRIDWLNQPAVLCFLTDISRYKSTETYMAESEQRYRNIIELSPYGIITMDTKGVIVSINSAFMALTGYEYEDFIGRHLSRIPTLHLSDIPRFIRLFAQLIKDGFDKPVEFNWVHKDGTERWGEARGVLLSRENKILGLQAIIRDITEQRRATQLLEALNRTALAVAQASKPQEMFTVMGKELIQLGIACVILLSRDQGKHLIPAYALYNSRAIQLAERLVRKKAENYVIDVEKVDVFRQVVWHSETVIASDPISGALQILPETL